MKNKSVLLLLFFVFFAFPLCAQIKKTEEKTEQKPNPIFSEKRYALVIGNANYANGKLVNPINDANDISKALKDLAFEVTTLTNANKKKMQQAIDDFGKKIVNADAALVYFSGHGVEVSGENYILPVDNANIQTQTDVKYDAVNTNDILKMMGAAESKFNFLIFDVCRNNPLPEGPRSLTRSLTVKKAPTEMQSLIVFSTASGQTAEDGAGRNSPFTASFLQHITSPGDIRIIMGVITGEVREKTNGRQTPSTSSTMTSPFFMTGIGSEADIPFIRPPSLREKMLQEETEYGKFIVRSSALLLGTFSNQLSKFQGVPAINGGGAQIRFSPWEFSWYPIYVQVILPAYSFSVVSNTYESSFTHQIEAGATVGYGWTPLTFYAGATVSYLFQDVYQNTEGETLAFGISHYGAASFLAGVRWRISLELAAVAEYNATVYLFPLTSPVAAQQRISVGLQYKFPNVFSWIRK